MTSDHDPAAKPPGYYGAAREDLIVMLPRPLGRTLDVGCGEGAVGVGLRNAGAQEVWGIEIFPKAAARAAEHYDRVVVGPVEDALAGEDLQGPFDTIACYDVLEHLIDPERILAQLRTLAAPGARLHVSVPNARHLGLVYDLMVRGTFGYTEFGHRDATHLHWFTRRDLEAMVTRTGWRVQASSPNPFRGRDRHLARFTPRRSHELMALQWNVVAISP